MAPLSDPELLACYKNALANWRYDGFIVFTELAQEWVRLNLPNFTPRQVGRLMHTYVSGGGEIDQQKETRPEWNVHEYHYDMRLPITGWLIYVETRLYYDDPDDADDPIIHVVSVHDAEQLEQALKQTAGDRPYPWRCPRCLRKTVSPVVLPYRATAVHDGQIYELDIVELHIPKCSSCGELVFGNRTDEQITQALRERLRLLRPEQIRDARRKLQQSVHDLAERLGVPPEMVVAWEEGTIVQACAADNLLRVYFALPEVRAVLIGANQDPSLGLPISG